MSVLYNKIYVNFLRTFRRVPFYQPTYMEKGGGFMLVSDTFLRGSLERSNLILDKIKAMSGSYLDIGSQLGYFVLKVSELDFIATGIECSEMPYRYSNSLKEIYNKNNE